MPKMVDIQAMRELRKKNQERSIPELDEMDRFWNLAAQLRKKDRVPPPGKIEGLWIRKIDERWLMKANGHKEVIDLVPPFSIYVEFQGWPAGMIDPNGATFANGKIANLKLFNDAIEAALRNDTPETPKA